MRLLICPYDYSGRPGVSHTGLHISTRNTMKVLQAAGLDVLSFPVTAAVGTPTIGTSIEQLVKKYDPTHIVTCAFWVPPNEMSALVEAYPYVTFAVNCHSNIAFLQAEAKAITMAQEMIDLEQVSHNFHLAGNSRGFVEAVGASWEAPAAYLPNLYYLDDTARESRPTFSGRQIRIGSFGALRPLKNPEVSAFAALGIATNLHANLEFFVNVGRNDGWGKQTLRAVRATFGMDPNTGQPVRPLPYAKLVEVPWQDWPSHRRLVRSMDVMLQPSFSESFNLVTADGAAEGIPSATGDAIEWVPEHWKGIADDCNDIARVGRSLLFDSNAARDGVHALRRNNDTGVLAWKRYLGVI